jgi:hypothetical protein
MRGVISVGHQTKASRGIGKNKPAIASQDELEACPLANFNRSFANISSATKKTQSSRVTMTPFNRSFANISSATSYLRGHENTT